MLPLLGVRVEDPKPWILITFNWNYDYELKQVRKDTDIVIKTQQHSHNFFVIFHNDVNARSNTFIHQLCKKQNLLHYTIKCDIFMLLPDMDTRIYVFVKCYTKLIRF